MGMQFYRRYIIAALLLYFCPLCLAGTPTVKQGDTLVFLVHDEDQDENGDITVFHEGEKVKIKRSISHRSEKAFTPDTGLEYGRPLQVGLKLDVLTLEPCPKGQTMWCYFVEKKEDVTVPAGTFTNCFKIVNEANPDIVTDWYYPGVGIVKEIYHHKSGTIADQTVELEKILHD